ncbi:hypothetical protein D3C86_2001580 [compost metagenome]
MENLFYLGVDHLDDGFDEHLQATRVFHLGVACHGGKRGQENEAEDQRYREGIEVQGPKAAFVR